MTELARTQTRRAMGHFAIRTAVLASLLTSALAAQQEGDRKTARTWEGRNTEFEEALRTAEILRLSEIGTGSTKPQIAEVAPGGVVRHFAWKPNPAPGAGNRRESSSYELAAYAVDRLLDLGYVPPTVERQISGRAGAAIFWLEGTQSFRDLGGLPTAPTEQQSAWNRQIVRAKMFHNLVGNSDPNLGNWLVDEHWNLYLIDHSRAFADSPQLVHEIARFDRELLQQMEELEEDDVTGAAGQWLSARQRKMMLRRVERMRSEIDKRLSRSSEAEVFLPSMP